MAISPVAICSRRVCSADLFATVWATGGDLHGYDVTAMSAYVRIAIVAETTPCWPWPVTDQVTTASDTDRLSPTYLDADIPLTSSNAT